MREVEPPGDDSRDRIEGRCGRLRLPVRAKQGDPDRAGVEAQGVRADDVPVDTPEASFVDRPEAVDEEVVADVVPAVSLDMKELDSPDDRGRFRTGVVVAPSRVVHDHEPGRARVARRPAPDRLVRTPGQPRNDCGLAACSRRPERDAELGAPHELCTDARDVPPSACLEAIRGTDPPRVAETPSGPPPLGGSRVRALLVLGCCRAPGAPTTAGRPRTKLHRPGTTPRDACQREAGRRPRHDEA